MGNCALVILHLVEPVAEVVKLCKLSTYHSKISLFAAETESAMKHTVSATKTISIISDAASTRELWIQLIEDKMHSLSYSNHENSMQFINATKESSRNIYLRSTIRHIHKWRTRKETMGPSACKRGLWGIVALFSFVFLPHKPCLHALGPIVLHLFAIYEYRYGVLLIN